MAVDEARVRWRQRFRARVQAMTRLIGKTPIDNTPTPSAIGDDMTLTDESAALVEKLVTGPGRKIPKLAAVLARKR